MKAWKENGNKNQYSDLVAEYKINKLKWEKSHPVKKGQYQVCGIVEIALMPFPPSRVSFNDVGVSLHVYGLYNTYDIEWNDIGSSLKCLLNWVQTLATKTWCDAELVHDFIECVSFHFKHKICEYD